MEIGMHELAVPKVQWTPMYAKYSHDALVDQILANPTATDKELGAVFNRSAWWVKAIRSSDMFREKLATRGKEIADPLMIASIEERLDMLTSRSIDVMLEKMSRPTDLIPDNLAVAAANFGAKAKSIGGFGRREEKDVPAPQADRIERLAERLVNLNGGQARHSQEIVDVQCREVSPPIQGRPEGTASHAGEPGAAAA